MSKIKRIHFLGIGGIGVSALAKYYLDRGHQISGSDLVSSEITYALEKLGAKIYTGPYNPKIIKHNFLDLVIYSLAVPANNPELKKAKKLGIKCQSYPETLGELTKKYFTIAVSGTHGKSTTAAMIGLILSRAGLDPTVIMGTKLKEFGDSNCRVGKSNYLVIEADEHTASFLNYWPKIIVLTNIEREHLDYYKSLSNILNTYKQYIRHLPNNGILIANGDDQNLKKIISPASKIRSGKHNFDGANFRTVYYSLKQKETEELKRILKIPGKHNIYNGLAALTLARTLKVPDRTSLKALSEYKGSWRRFEEKTIKLKTKQLKLISDYAHHPTEIKTTLKAAREKYPHYKIWCIFQPHQYQRTYYLFNDFVRSFDEADEIVLVDIYDVAGRENIHVSKKINSKILAQAIKKQTKKNVHFVPDFQKIPKFLAKKIKNNDVILIMGAGDIYKLFYLTSRFNKEKIK